MRLAQASTEAALTHGRSWALAPRELAASEAGHRVLGAQRVPSNPVEAGVQDGMKAGMGVPLVL